MICAVIILFSDALKCSSENCQVTGHGHHCQLRTCTKFHHASFHLASDNEVQFVDKANVMVEMCMFLLYVALYHD